MKYTRERKGTQESVDYLECERGRSYVAIDARIFLEHTFYAGLLRSWDRLSCHVQTLDTYVFTLQDCNEDDMYLTVVITSLFV